MKNYLKPLNNESGMVLLLAMLIMSALILLGTTAVMESQTDLRISGNYKTSAIAFYSAEAGIEEARARLRLNFAPTASIIVDSAPTDPDWTASINAANSLQSALSYTVNIKHKTNASNQILYCHSSGGGATYTVNTTVSPAGPVYVLTSAGASSAAGKTLEAMVTKFPPIPAPAALYVEAATSIQGTSTHIFGADKTAACGTSSLPGVATTLSAGAISKTGNPTVCGVNVTTCAMGDWDVVGGATNLDVQQMITNLKGSANYSYNYTTNQTDTGMNWGTPVVTAQDDPSSCTVSNVVYYNMNGGDIRLSGGASGCGILIVDGDLELNGGFNWYGMILVSGSVTIAGGGDKNITGSVVAGGSTEADLVGGNTSIVYCSAAIDDATKNASLRVLSWTEK